jgi:hypothetical protein
MTMHITRPTCRRTGEFDLCSPVGPGEKNEDEAVDEQERNIEEIVRLGSELCRGLRHEEGEWGKE